MKLVIQIIAMALACYGMIVAVLYFFQEKMLFFPMGQAFGNCRQMERYGAEAVSSNGIRYYLKRTKSAESWIIVFHGNAGNACDRSYFFDLLTGLKSHVVLCEYPGYGGDNRKPGEKIILEQALMLVKEIKKQEIKTRNDKHLPVFLLGESLGTGVATWVSSQTPVSGLILISAYTAIVDVARHHYPWLPVQYLLRDRFEASVWASETTTPAILFHGIEDDIIPIKFARKQVKHFRSDAELFEIEHCGHNDIVDTGKMLIKKEINRFVSAAGG